ncbi:MAG: peptidoglycan editing factor PgeF [Planctomycetota bacterium]
MIEKYADNVPLWSFQNLLPCKQISHFISTRNGGFSKPPYNSLNLGFHVGDNPEIVLENRQRLATALGIPLVNFTTVRQVHGGNVVTVKKPEGALHYDMAIPETDAMITDVPNIYLMVLQADCVPMLFFDAEKKAIGASHAGWRGTLSKIAQNTVRALQERFNCLPKNIYVGIGPSIGPCCYEVGAEIISKITSNSDVYEGYMGAVISENKGFFNLWEANKRQLMQMGIPEKNIEVAQICTRCNHDRFFSYRYQQKETGRFGAGIILNT